MTLNDLERRNGRIVCVISPNSVAFGPHYANVVEYTRYIQRVICSPKNLVSRGKRPDGGGVTVRTFATGSRTFTRAKRPRENVPRVRTLFYHSGRFSSDVTPLATIT